MVAAVIAAISLSACQPVIPKDALLLKEESLEDRQLQTRLFDTKHETKLLTASAQVLQDLGFTLEESETKLGLIVGSKDRDATETGQVVGAVVMAVLFGVAVPIDKNQKIRVSLVSKPSGTKQTAVRVTFQRIVWNTQNQVSKTEFLNDPEMYQKFFDQLSESVFLTAHEI
ncbi:MAG: hypothetical protein GC131_07965 [Alphaproteobacteria bacterium]|nr:hypothetical protein [Alphaproteobacteria bacterium]